MDKIIYLQKASLEKKVFEGNEIKFCIIGHITPNKGQEDAIRAIALVRKKFPNIKLTIAGNGKENEINRLKKNCAGPSGFRCN